MILAMGGLEVEKREARRFTAHDCGPFKGIWR